MATEPTVERDASRNFGCATIGLAVVGALGTLGALQLSGVLRPVAELLVFGMLVAAAITALFQGSSRRKPRLNGFAMLGLITLCVSAIAVGVFLLFLATNNLRF